MLSILLLGFLIGLSHAIEPDHVAAVSALVSGKSDRRSILRHGVTWGIGHALILLVVGGGALLIKVAISPNVALGLEAIVGLMLIGLGGQVLYRLRREKVHFHQHSHGDNLEHIHVHSHAKDKGVHNTAAHRHRHPDPVLWRSLLVGMMHGLAGSAVIIVAVAATFGSALQGIGYIAVFGAGSVAGMALVSVGLSVPLVLSAQFFTGASGYIQRGIGGVTAALGVYVFTISIRAIIG